MPRNQMRRLRTTVLFILVAVSAHGTLAAAQSPPAAKDRNPPAKKKDRPIDDKTQAGPRSFSIGLGGKVVLANGSSPAAGWVKIASADKPSETFEARTDEQGGFALPMTLPAGKYIVHAGDGASAPTTYSNFHAGPLPAPPLVLRLNPGATLQFRQIEVFVSSAHDPVADARVNIRCEDGTEISTETGSEGRATIVNLLPGLCRISVNARNTVVDKSFDPAKSGSVELQLPRAFKEN